MLRESFYHRRMVVGTLMVIYSDRLAFLTGL